MEPHGANKSKTSPLNSMVSRLALQDTVHQMLPVALQTIFSGRAAPSFSEFFCPMFMHMVTL
jgi:hypothetical protein